MVPLQLTHLSWFVVLFYVVVISMPNDSHTRYYFFVDLQDAVKIFQRFVERDPEEQTNFSMIALVNAPAFD